MIMKQKKIYINEGDLDMFKKVLDALNYECRFVYLAQDFKAFTEDIERILGTFTRSSL